MNDDIRLKSLISFFFVALGLLLLVISIETGGRKLETGVQSPLRPIFDESIVPGLEGCPSRTSDLHANQPLTMKNPSAVYCRDLGYDFRVIDNPDGSQDSICILPGKTICPAWDFLNGKCGQEYSVCAKNGLKTVTLDDGNNPFSKEYAVCADANGKLLESVTDMANLVEKKDGQARNDGFDPLAAPTGSPPVNESPDGDLPTSFDWRSYNGSDWMTPVKNQGICGSCWAFSAVGLAEAVTNIASNNPHLDLNLAEQYLVSGCSSAGNCNGGNVAVSLGFIRDNGIPDETCFPYLDGGSNGCTYNSSGCDASMCTYASTSECSDYRCTDRCSNWASRLAKIQSYTYLGNFPAIASMKQALVDHGPLSVYMNMGGSFNASNVYTCSDGTYTNHAVIIVGYNDPGGYWIVKNSWGTSWGTNGYFNVMYDNCAIQSHPFYAVGIPSGNPIPSITNLNPSSATAGGSAFTLTVNGSNFVSASVVRWNGSDRLTTFVSSAQLTASISAADIASAGTMPVTVFNPTPGGGTCAAVNFTINPTATSTNTPTKTTTPTAFASLTNTLSPTPTGTATSTPTRTATSTPTPTTTHTPTRTSTPTAVATLTYTLSPTPTRTHTSTPSRTPTSTPTATTTHTPTKTTTPTTVVTLTSTLSPTPTRTATSTRTPTSTPTRTSTPPVTMFTISHEANNFNEYDTTYLDGGNLSISTAAALNGTHYGLRVNFPGGSTTPKYAVKGMSLLADSDFRCLFYFDPNTITLSTATIRILNTSEVSTGYQLLGVVLKYASSNYRLFLGVINDSHTYSNGSEIIITDAPHYIEVLAHRSSSAGRTNGFYKMWIDGKLKSIVSNVSNYNQFGLTNQISFGAPGEVVTGVTGTYYIDEINANRDGRSMIGTSTEFMQFLPLVLKSR